MLADRERADKVGAPDRHVKVPVLQAASGTGGESTSTAARSLRAAVHDPFRAVSFAAPAPPPPSPLPKVPEVTVAPAKVAPPFPYRYFGRTTGPDGRPAVYLIRDDKLIAVQAHQMLDPDYRIEALDAARIVVTYVPLGEKVILTTGAADE